MKFRADRLGDQSPSIKCSVVGAVPEFSNWWAGRPVPERIVLGGRYNPRANRLGDQSPSVECLVVGAVLEVPS